MSMRKSEVKKYVINFVLWAWLGISIYYIIILMSELPR